MDDAFQLVGLPYPMVVGLFLPELFRTASMHIALLRGIALHALHNSFTRRLWADEGFNPFLPWPENPVKVARHHDEGVDVVSLAGKVEQGVHDQACQVGVTE